MGKNLRKQFPYNVPEEQVYKDRVKQDMRKKADIAFQELEADMMKVIKQDEESVRMLKTILTKAKDRMMQDD